MLHGRLLKHDRGESPPDQLAFPDLVAYITIAADEAFDQILRLNGETPQHASVSWWLS